MATQLEQLLAYFDRPGVTELTLCAGKPITMRTTKGVMNVTGRALAADQMASLVRGTPLEALVADESGPDEPVKIMLLKRDVTIEITHGGDHPTVRIVRVPDKQRPPARGKRTKAVSEHSALRIREITPKQDDSEADLELPKAEQLEVVAPEHVDVLDPPRPTPKKSRTNTEPRASDLVPPAKPATPMHTLMGLPVPPAAPPALLDLEPPAELELPPVPSTPEARTKPPSIGPPGLALDFSELGPPHAFDLELPPPVKPVPTSKPLRIDMKKMTEPPALASSEQSGIIALDRAPGMPLAQESRSLEALGLPEDIATSVARERGLVLITAPHGHGKTSTLGALFDRIDRAAVPHVVTIDALRDRESIDLALSMAESGYFVLATLTAQSPGLAIETLLDAYPGMTHARVKTRLTSALVAVIAKRLPPTPSEIVQGDALRKLL